MSNDLLGSTPELGVLLMWLQKLELRKSRGRVERGEEYILLQSDDLGGNQHAWVQAL